MQVQPLFPKEDNGKKDGKKKKIFSFSNILSTDCLNSVK